MGKNTAAADSKTGKQIQQKMNQLINLKRCYVISSDQGGGHGPCLPPCSSATGCLEIDLAQHREGINSFATFISLLCMMESPREPVGCW